MSLIKKIIGGISMLCAFGCTSSNPEQERQEMIKWLNHHIHQLGEQLISDIESEKKGFYPHEGKTGYHSRGKIEYVLKEKTGKRLEVSERSLLTLDDIKNTEAYRELAQLISEAGYQLELKRLTIDGDEVETYMELDEHIMDQQEYFIISVSGW